MARLALPAPATLHEHQQRWHNCEQCSLCATRHRVALFRYVQNRHTTSATSFNNASQKNRRPQCDILGIGEAPGEWEDVDGKPFAGPAGRLLETMIYDAGKIFFESHSRSRFPLIGLTNIVACFPQTADSAIRQPDQDEAEACRDRLLELIVSASPSWIICFGKTAVKFFPGGFNHALDNFSSLYGTSQLEHPAHILRLENHTKRETEKAIYSVQLAGIMAEVNKVVVSREAANRKVHS